TSASSSLVHLHHFFWSPITSHVTPSAHIPYAVDNVSVLAENTPKFVENSSPAVVSIVENSSPPAIPTATNSPPVAIPIAETSPPTAIPSAAPNAASHAHIPIL
ncbi:hypothetical protein U1Q18_012408, partial [Sarracenia purpurea var. burkii]